MLQAIKNFDYADFSVNAFGNFCIALVLAVIFANLEWDILYTAAALNLLAFGSLGIVGAVLWVAKHVRISIRIV